MRAMYKMAVSTALLVTGLGAVAAAPLKTRTYGTKSQNVTMCAECKEKIACAKVGDYTIGFNADLETPKVGTARVGVHLLDKAGNPVDDAKVVVNLTMPDHKHGKKPLTLKSVGHGRYEAGTQFVIPGAWRADVAATVGDGDTVKQAFSFSR